MAFGPILGFILNYVGIVIGSIILFLLTRRYGKPFIMLFIDEQTYAKYEEKLASSTYETVFALNMASPISPADILVMITGLSKMSFNLTARNSPTSKVAGCKGFGLVQGLAPCA